MLHSIKVDICDIVNGETNPILGKTIKLLSKSPPVNQSLQNSQLPPHF